MIRTKKNYNILNDCRGMYEDEEELKNKIATLTGGRCAEELVFGSVTTGASAADLEWLLLRRSQIRTSEATAV